MMTETQFIAMMTEARQAADAAVLENDAQEEGGNWVCFGWLDLYTYEGNDIDGRSTIGKLLSKHGVCRHTKMKSYRFWNPSTVETKNKHSLRAGLRAAAAVFVSYGFSMTYDGW